MRNPFRRLLDWWQGWELLSHLASFEYTNHQGETIIRRVFPQYLWFGKTQWHPEPQWFLRAYDTNKQAYRDFAMRDIHRWL
jgi:predicted DNA-binding transcriptional regulator YafY